MRHFIAYHNADKMGYSSTALSDTHVMTKKPITGLEGTTIWLVAGEGRRPKSFYLAAKFVADKCEPNKHPGTELPNEISGSGVLYKLGKPINGTLLLEQIRKGSRNFRNGFHELTDASIISGLVSLA